MLEVKHANEKYELKRKQKIEECEHELRDDINYNLNLYETRIYNEDLNEASKRFFNNLNDCILKKLIKLKCDINLYFNFGKYKGRIVQDILKEDRKYCIWFVDNVIGRDFITLKTIDYIHKKLNNSNYYLEDVSRILDTTLREFIPESILNSLYENNLIQDYLKSFYKKYETHYSIDCSIGYNYAVGCNYDTGYDYDYGSLDGFYYEDFH